MNVFTESVMLAEKMYPAHPSVADFFRMMEAVEDIPEEKPAPVPYRFHTAHPYEGKHEIDKAKIYDAEFAEINADKAIRAEKFRKTHDMRKKSKDDTPADRKRNKIRRIRKMYGVCFEDGKDWYWENGKDGQKKSTAIGAEILRNLKVAEMEKSAYADMIPDVEHRVGFNAVQRIMYNADKRMREIRAEVAEGRYDDTIVETYDNSYVVRCGDGGFQFSYPDDYYWWKATWESYEYMIRKYGMEYANKYARGEI